MDTISKVFHRARIESLPGNSDLSNLEPLPSGGPVSLHGIFDNDTTVVSEPLEINRPSLTYLRSKRIIAFDNTHRITRYYDMLRNQLREGSEAQPHSIAVTAPTTGCGATISTINLALSYARLPTSNVLIVDANVRDPAIGRLLGLPFLSGRQANKDPASGWLTTLEFGNIRTHFLRPAWGMGKLSPAAEIQRLRVQVEQARQYLKPSVIVYDVAPMLVCDETLPLVQEADTVVMVLASGVTKLADVEVCQTFLGSKKNVQFVLNKSGRHGL